MQSTSKFSIYSNSLFLVGYILLLYDVVKHVTIHPFVILMTAEMAVCSIMSIF